MTYADDFTDDYAAMAELVRRLSVVDPRDAAEVERLRDDARAYRRRNLTNPGDPPWEEP